MKTRMIIALLCCAATCIAAQTQPAEPKTELRAYDVRSLVMSISDYPLGTSAPGSSGASTELFVIGRATTQPAEDPVEQKITELTQLIQELVATDTWRENGGSLGQIRRMGSVLLITHEPSVHQQISALLQMLPQRGRMARVRATWVVASREDLSAIGAIDPKSSAVLPEVNFEAMKKNAKLKSFSAETVCFTAQTVHLNSGKTHRYIHDFNPVVGQQAVGLDSDVAEFVDGASLQVTPTIGDDGKTVVLDVHSRAGEWHDKASTQPDANAMAKAQVVAGEASIDRPDTLTSELDTTVRMPTGRPILIGGMTVDPSNSAAGTELLLIVEVLTGE